MATSKRIPEEDVIDDDMDEEGISEIEFIASFLQNDEGENIAQVMSTLCKHIENQNKLFVKLIIGLEKIVASNQSRNEQSQDSR